MVTTVADNSDEYPVIVLVVFWGWRKGKIWMQIQMQDYGLVLMDR